MSHEEVLPPAEPSDDELVSWDWRAALDGRPMTWLAKETGRAEVTVRAYAHGRRRPPVEWLRHVARILGRRAAA